MSMFIQNISHKILEAVFSKEDKLLSDSVIKNEELESISRLQYMSGAVQLV